jgi:hypothetical protein
LPLRPHRPAAPDDTAAARVGPGIPLVARRLRARVWCVVAGLALIVAAGGILVHGDETPLGIEVRIQHGVDRHGGGAAAWNPVFSSVIPVAIIAVVIALVAWSLARRWWRAVAACAAVPLAIVVAELVLKPLVDRGSSGSGLLYPSGHLTGLGATATLVLVLVGPRLPRSWAWLGLAVACVLACGGGVLAAVASHAHGPVDTVAGIPTGIAVALGWVLVVDAVADASAGPPAPAPIPTPG